MTRGRLSKKPLYNNDKLDFLGKILLYKTKKVKIPFWTGWRMTREVSRTLFLNSLANLYYKYFFENPHKWRLVTGLNY